MLPYLSCSEGIVFAMNKWFMSHKTLFRRKPVFKFITTCHLQNDCVVETSLVGTVMNGLSHLHGCTDRGQFIINLLRGLGGNLNMKSRQEFAKEVIIFSSKFIKKFSVV